MVLHHIRRKGYRQRSRPPATRAFPACNCDEHASLPVFEKAEEGGREFHCCVGGRWGMIPDPTELSIVKSDTLSCSYETRWSGGGGSAAPKS